MEHERIAIFPLSNVVLFPGVETPLHLFEPRYRQMAEEVLRNEPAIRHIGMVVVPPEFAGEMAGNPPVYPIGCAGQIRERQRLPDGRYNLVLSGEFRFRIRDEPTGPADRLYRVAEIERLEDPLPETARSRLEELRQRISGQVRELVARADPEQAEELGAEVLPEVGLAAFVNTLSNGLAFSPPEKQGLLEADSVAERFERLEGLLAFRLAGVGPPQGGSESLH